MNPKVLLLVWANRARIYAVAKGLHWSRRTWMGVGLLAAVVGALAWMATHGRIVGPSSWPPVQWVLIVVNVVGFAWLYLMLRAWFANQDDVWDEVSRMRSELDAVREFAHGHEHDVVEHEDRDVLPTAEEATAELPLVGGVHREFGGRTFTFRG